MKHESILVSALPLPIDSHLPRILQTLAASNCLVIEAPPGTGKTTRVAPALLSNLSADDRIVLIQPRRIAARAAASRIAHELGCDVGTRVGYQVRFDSRVSRSTQLVSMTPGILLRRLQTDVVLSNVAGVVLDEFHERSLEVDLLLGMLRRIQNELRPELRIVIMSATLDAAELQHVLGAPPVIEVDAKAYPVTIRYSRFQSPSRSGPRSKPLSPGRRIVEQVSETVIEAARSHEGDILAFLPGVGEIMQVARNLEVEAERQSWDLMTLFGDMSPRDQDRVLSPSQRRKIILSTNIAETSLTIDGVRIVIDSGWARVARVDSAVGLNKLVLEPISGASAKQRAGRAGRTAPGICFRLWDEVTDRGRSPHLEPEILRVDLAGALLHLTAWGEKDVTAFPWVTPPRNDAIEQAHATLQRIGATQDGVLTELGQTILKLPVHPRIGRFLVECHRFGIPRAGSLAAAVLNEREIFDRRSMPTRLRAAPVNCDLTSRLMAIREFEETGRTESAYGAIKTAALRSVKAIAEQFLQLITRELGDAPEDEVDIASKIPRCLLVAFPDRLARRRAAGTPRGLMVGGRGVKLDAASGVQRAELFLCLDVDAGSSEATVRQASAIEFDWLPQENLRSVDERFFNPTQAAVVARRRVYWLDLMLTETPIATPHDEETAHTLAIEAAKQFHRLLPAKDKELQSWLARVEWLSLAMPDSGLPSLQPEELTRYIENWCFGMRSIQEVKGLPWRDLLHGLLDSAARKQLEAAAPESVTLPSGRRVTLQYEPGKPPVLAARIQEFFGLQETPRLAGGRVPLLLHLLAPNNRVQQITDDLASFWKNTYPQVRKDLRGRYPKHSWPEDPLNT